MPSATEFLGLDAAPQQAQPQSTIPSAEDFLNQPEQMTGIKREIALPASSFANGLLSFPGTFGDLKALGDKYVSDPLLRLFGADPNATSEAQKWSANPATTAEWNAVGKEAGITDRPDLVPQNEREKIEAAGFQGAGAAAPYALLGGAPAVVPTLLSGAGGGVGSMYGERVGEKIGMPQVGAVAGGLLGGMGTAGLTNLGVRGVNAALGNGNQTIQAMDRLGITPRLAGDVTGNPTLQSAQTLAEKLPFGEGRVIQAARDTASEYSNAVDRTASILGSAKTLEDAGTAMKADARNWLTNVMPQKQQEVWEPVNTAIMQGGPANASVSPDNYRAALASMSKRLTNLPQTKDVLLSDRAKSLLDAINKDVPVGSSMSWQDAQNLRSTIGEIRGVPEIAQALGDKQLGGMYGALTADMRRTAGANGVSRAFDAANAESTRLYAYRDNVLSKIIGSPNPLQDSIAPETAAKTILGTGRTGDTTLAQVRQEMPRSADELAAAKLRMMATPPDSVRDFDMPYSSATLHTNLGPRNLSPEARQTLFGANPAVKQAVDDLESVGGAVKDTVRRYGNSSGTAPMVERFALLGALTGAPFTALKAYELGGVPAAVAATGAELAPFSVGPLAARAAVPPQSFLGVPIARPMFNLLGAPGYTPAFRGQSALLGGNAARSTIASQPPALLGPQ